MNYLSRYILWRYVKRSLEGRNRDREHPESGRITPSDIRLIVSQAEKNYQALKDTMPDEKTWGARMMVKNGIWSLSLYLAIKIIAKNNDYATELCTDILWRFYTTNIAFQRRLARTIHRDRQKQMNMIQQMFLRFPLAGPGYICTINEINTVCAYDIHRCPVYDYFKSRSQEELDFFRSSWCMLDFPLAEHLVKDGRYERPHTLSSGDDRCDMRWMAD